MYFEELNNKAKENAISKATNNPLFGIYLAENLKKSSEHLFLKAFDEILEGLYVNLRSDLDEDKIMELGDSVYGSFDNSPLDEALKQKLFWRIIINLEGRNDNERLLINFCEGISPNNNKLAKKIQHDLLEWLKKRINYYNKEIQTVYNYYLTNKHKESFLRDKLFQFNEDGNLLD